MNGNPSTYIYNREVSLRLKVGPEAWRRTDFVNRGGQNVEDALQLYLCELKRGWQKKKKFQKVLNEPPVQVSFQGILSLLVNGRAAAMIHSDGSPHLLWGEFWLFKGLVEITRGIWTILAVIIWLHNMYIILSYNIMMFSFRSTDEIRNSKTGIK